MPRSNSARRSNYKPATISPSPAQATVQHTVEAPSFGQSMKQGFGFGMGSAIAHNIFGLRPVVNNTTTTEANIRNSEYEKCMKESFNDKEVCKQYLSEERR